MTNYVYIATSLDGHIATSEGGLDWLNEVPNPEQSDYGFADFMSGIDAIVMGRNTFETVRSFGVWPYERPVFVLSENLPEIPAELAGKAELVGGERAGPDRRSSPARIPQSVCGRRHRRYKASWRMTSSTN